MSGTKYFDELRVLRAFLIYMQVRGRGMLQRGGRDTDGDGRDILGITLNMCDFIEERWF